MDPDAIPPEDEIQALVLQWIPFAISLAKNHFRDDSRFDYEERVGEALYALCLAAEKFDVSRGASFGSYAGRVIWDKLRKASYKRGSLISRPAMWRKQDVDEPGQKVLSISSEATVEHTGFQDVDNADLVEWIMEILDSQQQAVARGLMHGKRQDQIGRKVPRQNQRRSGVSRHRVSELKDEIHKLVEAKEWDSVFEYINKQVEGIE